MKPLAILALVCLGSACGNGAEPEKRANPPSLRVVFAEAGTLAPQAATAPTAPPVTLVFRFLGPDGALEQRVAYDIGRLALDDLRVGTWQVSAEGLDANDLVTWEAAPVVFDIHEDRTTDVDLVFKPL